MLKVLVLLYLVFTIFVKVHSIESSLELINDNEFMNLIRTENHVVVLFSKADCELCNTYETKLSSLRDDIVETLNAWVVKLYHSELVRLYSPAREPALVFFRHGVPLLYEGSMNEEEILQTLIESKEPAVKELSDKTFEHLTQASSGATTGDWFIMFYSTECIECQRLQARWEAVGSKLKRRINVALVNKATSGAATARRFNVYSVPAFLLFRHGKLYRYDIQKYDINSFVGFAQDWYKNMKPERVPVPKSPFDDVTDLIANYLIENSWLWKLGSIAVGIGILAAIIMRKRSSVLSDPKKKK